MTQDDLQKVAHIKEMARICVKFDTMAQNWCERCLWLIEKLEEVERERDKV